MIGLVVGLLFAISPAAAAQSEAAGTASPVSAAAPAAVGEAVTPACTPYYVTLTFAVFLGDGTIVFNGYTYSSGSTDTVLAGCGESYSISKGSITDSTYSFLEWLSNAGSVANSRQLSTTFTPSSSGNVVMALDRPVGYAVNWGYQWSGYVVSGANFNTVSGTIHLPTSATWAGCLNAALCNAGYTDNLVSFWVGIQGWEPNDNANLWQAGVDVVVHRDNSRTLRAWYEDLPIPSQPAPAWFNSYLRLGDQVTDSVSFQSSNSQGCFSLQDVSSGSPPWGQCLTLAYPPPTDTAEWLAEAGFSASYGQIPIPAVTGSSFSSLSSTAGSGLVFPLLRLNLEIYFCDGCGGDEQELISSLATSSPPSFSMTYYLVTNIPDHPSGSPATRGLGSLPLRYWLYPMRDENCL